MGFWKFSPFLALNILVLCQVGIIQAAPFRSASESNLHPALLNEEEGDLLVDALMKDYVKRMASEQEQETEDFSVILQKKGCNMSTCVVDNLADLLSKHGGLPNNDSVPTNVGPNSYGRRRRDLQS